MKALVLAGGHGTRLRPITHTSAKQLIPVANRPVLFYGLDALSEAGIQDIGIIVGDTADEIREAVGDGSKLGIDVTYIEQDYPRGLAHCVMIARDFLGDDEFVMYLGDNFLVGGITEFVEEFAAGSHDAEILLTPVADPQHFGVAEVDDEGQIVRLAEKSPNPPSDLAIVGVYIFRPAIHDAVRAIEPSWRGELEITDAIQWLIDAGKQVHSRRVKGYWKDTGRLEDMLECNRTVLESIEGRIDGTVDDETQIVGHVVVQEGASIEHSHIRGPAIIGENTIVRNSYIGPFTSIYHSCLIEDSEIEHSIILEGARIQGAGRLEDSLIGKEVSVVRSSTPPVAYRLMLGDHSQIVLP
jgi:glucose-1-phosphate thymidylyltransferase